MRDMFVAYRSIQAGLAAFLPYSAPLSHPFLTQPGRLFLFFPPPLSLSLFLSLSLSLTHTHTHLHSHTLPALFP